LIDLSNHTHPATASTDPPKPRWRTASRDSSRRPGACIA
jgi:hypothetical protein